MESDVIYSGTIMIYSNRIIEANGRLVCSLILKPEFPLTSLRRVLALKDKYITKWKGLNILTHQQTRCK
jgi:hypothetical protein